GRPGAHAAEHSAGRRANRHPTRHLLRPPFTGYVLADSKQAEIDYSLGQTEQYTEWKGKTGVPLSSALRSLAFAIRFGDVNMLISPQLSSQTQVLFNRDVTDRVDALAPFLQFDQDPYVVVVDGRIYWILDGYTV